MTTVPNRLSEDREGWGLRESLKILLNLSYEDYELHLNIPEKNINTGENYIIPDWLKNIKERRLKVFMTDDYGPITKIVPTLYRVSDPDTILITVDDDLRYEDGFIEYHLKKRLEYPEAILGFAGLDPVDDLDIRFATSVEKDVRVKIIEGYKTVSYKRSFFRNDFFTDFVGKHWNDDITISAYAGKHHIHKIVMAYDKDTNFEPRVESFPVIGHLPVEMGGCNVFRENHTQEYQDIENRYYSLGYLER
jgi:hypothetical protein